MSFPTGNEEEKRSGLLSEVTLRLQGNVSFCLNNSEQSRVEIQGLVVSLGYQIKPLQNLDQSPKFLLSEVINFRYCLSYQELYFPVLDTKR